MHFSALSGFIKAQVAHFHLPSSEGGFSPAAPQSNPPPVPLPAIVVVVVVVGGTAPNPVKLGLNADPSCLGAPNKNAGEVVGVDGAKLEAPNRDGPEGRADIGSGFCKSVPVEGPEEGAPGFGASQIVHFSLADVGFIKQQVPHFHSSGFDIGGFNPIAPQSNPLELESGGVAVVVVAVEALSEPKRKGVEGGFDIGKVGAAGDPSAPGFGVSHTVHFSVADAGFGKIHVPHVRPSVFVGGFTTAALQSNPPELGLEEEVAAIGFVGVELAPKKSGAEGGLGTEKEDAMGLTAPGLGASHTAHFSVAEVAFIKSQVPHFHPSTCFGGLKPAAAQSNPAFVGVVVEPETGRAVRLVLEPALLRLDDPAGGEGRLHPSPIGISS